MPQPKGLYKVQVNNRNAFWSYEYTGTSSVLFRWGRIGQTGQQKPKDFGDPYARDRAVEKKIAEQLRDGYQPETEEGLRKEIQVADALGTQYKIQHLHFPTGRIGNQFTLSKDYDPAEGVIVEIMNSWTKESEFLHLTRTDSIVLGGGRIIGRASSPTACTFTSTSPCKKEAWVRAIRKFIKDTAKVVSKIILEQFGMVNRVLDLGTPQEDIGFETTLVEMVRKQDTSSSMVGEQVLMSFAALGSRVLDL